MTTPTTTAIVRFSVPGFHCWEGATGDRAYLADRHRHLFHVEAKIQVWHSDRELEYHDFLDFCRAHFPGGEMGGQSCEMMAENLIETIQARYPGRSMTVSVFEDGEVGAEINSPFS